MHAGMTLAEMEGYIRGMTPEAQSQLQSLVQPLIDKPWLPQPGPQATAYDHPADETLYGGAAGGGKTDLVIGLATTSHKRSLIFRRQATDLDGLWERLLEVLGARAPREQNSVKKRLITSDNRLIEMGHLEAQGSEKSWQGRAHDLIAFDEAAQLDEAKVMFVMQWLRSVDPGQRTRVVFATNPPVPEMRGGELIDVGSGDYLIRWFAPWIDPHYQDKAEPGEIRWAVMSRQGDRFETHWVPGPGWYSREDGTPWDGEEPDPSEITRHQLAKAKSRTFIKSLVRDNAFLSGTGYVERLSATPEPLRSMLMDGVFGLKLQDHEWQVIQTNWVVAAQQRWRDRVEKIRDNHGQHLEPMLVLAADIAQGGVDTTVLAPLRTDNFFDEMITAPGEKTPTGVEVTEMLIRAQTNSAMIVLDGGGGWGGATKERLKSQHDIDARLFNPSEKSTAWTRDMFYRFLNQRAEIWWKFREALDPDSGQDICLPPSPVLLAQLTAVHYAIDKNVIKIESKDSLRKRLGSSTDEADAVLMAWHYRAIAAAHRYKADPVRVEHGGWNYEEKDRHKARQMATPEIDPLDGWDL